MQTVACKLNCASQETKCIDCRRREYMREYMRDYRAGIKRRKIAGNNQEPILNELADDNVEDDDSKNGYPEMCTQETQQKIVDETIEKWNLPNFIKTSCSSCHRMTVKSRMQDETFCEECFSFIKKSELPPHSISNGFDFGDIPVELRNLTLLEEILISRVRIRYTIVKLKMATIPRGDLLQSAIRGNVIAFPQESSSIYKLLSLPSHPSVIPEFMKIILTGQFTESSRKIAISKYGKVRREKVLSALRWKINNDPYYRNIVINDENLEAYPEDDIPVQLDFTSSEVAANDKDRDLREMENCVSESESVIPSERVGYIDLNGNSIPIDKLESIAFENAILKVSHMSDPADSYTDEYWAGAFPTLFCYGRGLPNSVRAKKQSFKQWAKHCLNYEDRRFRVHPTFMFIVYNIMKIREVCLSVRLRCKGNVAKDLGEIFRQVSPDDFIRIADDYKNNRSVSDSPMSSTVQRILRQINVTGAPILGSVHSKVYRRNEIRGLMIRYGLPLVWLTLNPSELSSPFIPLLSGLSEEIAAQLNSTGRLQIVSQDPVSVAEYFNYFIETVFQEIISRGLLGKYITHYGVVETQDRGGLHLHTLVWIKGFPPPDVLKKRMNEDTIYREEVIRYRDSVISESLLENSMEGVVNKELEYVDLKRFSNIQDEAFKEVASYIASKTNMHKTSHTSSCRKFGNSECRFNFPRALSENSNWNNETGAIVGKRNNAWINAFSPFIAYLTRCNHDIQLLSTANDSLALIYYITDYATKRQLKSYEIITLIAAAVKKTHALFDASKSAIEAENLSRIALIKCINTIGSVQEISGPLCALHILYERETYTPESFVNLNWTSIHEWYMRHFSDVTSRLNFPQWDDDEVVVSGERNDYSNLRKDYMYRGNQCNIEKMSLYVYASTVYKTQKKLASVVGQGNIAQFARLHPQFSGYVQHIRTKDAPCVVLLGKKFPDIESKREEYCSAVLTLFKPWDYSNPVKSDNVSWEESFAKFMEESDDSLGNPYNSRYSIPSFRKLIENIQLLKKCKDAADGSRSKRAEQKEVQQENTLRENEQNDINEEFSMYEDDSKNVEGDIAEELSEDMSLLQIRQLSENSSSVLANERFKMDAFEKVAILVPIPEADLFTCRISTSSSMSSENSDVNQWVDIQKKAETVENIRESLLDASNLSMSAVLDSYNMSDNRTVQILGCLCPPLLAKKVSTKRSLNHDQMRAFGLIAMHESSDNPEQLLMYLGGAAGTGKSEVIKALEDYFCLRLKRKALCLSASTGTAARKFKGSTIHSLCKFGKSNTSASSAKMSKKNKALAVLWSEVEYLIIDEVSMISASLLAEIHCTLQIAKGNSNKPFGGVNIILSGDFFQFPPVMGTPLYDELGVSRPISEKDVLCAQGLNLWSQFQTVVMLKQNYRQLKDARYQLMLSNHLKSGLSVEDIEVLRTRIINRNLIPTQGTPIIVNRNSLRTLLNNYFVQEICSSKRILPVEIRASDSCSNEELNVNAESVRKVLLEMEDNKTDSLPGILKVFNGMRCMVTANIDTTGGLANGTIGTIVGIPEPINGQRLYLLFKPDDGCWKKYPGLPEGIAPIFPKKGSFKVTLENRRKASVTINRTQFPIIPAYVITDYKSQGDTLKSVLLDIRKPPTGKWAVFFALYVCLSRVSTLDGLYILNGFDDQIFSQRPPKEINNLVRRLDFLDQICEEKADLSWFND